MALEYYKARNSNYATVGLEVVLSVLFGFLVGRWLDGKFATSPYIAIAGFVFGLATAARFLVRAARRMKAETQKDGFREADAGRAARYALDHGKDGRD
jgi:F0F1-type ATP synthase assembly protein I